MTLYGRLDADGSVEALCDAGLSARTAAMLLERLATIGIYLMHSPMHGTRASYTSGWPLGDPRAASATKGPGCRCEPCRAANAAYSVIWRARRAARAFGEWPPTAPPAAGVDHLGHLRRFMRAGPERVR